MTERSASATGLSVQVPRGTDAPAFARNVVQTWCSEELPAEQLADLLVIVSELTTNAVLHGVGEIRLRISVENGVVFGAVIDQGDGFLREAPDHGIAKIGKQGLPIIAAMAEHWGILEGSSHVWFELAPAMDANPSTPSSERTSAQIATTL